MLPVLRWSGPGEDERRAAVRAWKRAIQIAVDAPPLHLGRLLHRARLGPQRRGARTRRASIEERHAYVHGRNRVECMMRLRRALDEFVVDGIKTTLPLFRELINNPDIANGDYDIHWLEKYLASQE